MKKKEKLKNAAKVSPPIGMSSKLSLDKEIISLLNNDDGNATGKIVLSIAHWVDCGAHSPHWCNTKCGGGIRISYFYGNHNTDDCGTQGQF